MADPALLLQQLQATRPQQAREDADPSEVLGRLRGSQGQADLDVLFVTPNGGQVTRSREGVLSYSDDAWMTNDPEQVQRIMEGEAPGDVAKSSFDRDTIAKAPAAARAQEFLRGIPFVGSYTDELMGATKGEGAARNARALSSAMQRENPVETTALNVGGAIAGSIPLAVAAPEVAAMAPASRIGQAVTGAAAGGALGAAEGAVYRYGEDGDAGGGAAVGAALGATLGIAAPYATALAKWMAGNIKGSDVGAIASQLGVSKEAATVIRNAFRSGDAGDAAARIDQAGPRAMLADAGQPAAELLDASAAAGGEAGAIARRAVDERAGAASAELNSALDTALGAPVGRNTAVDSLRQGTSSARSQAYDAAYSQPIDYAAGRGRYIEGLLKRVPQSAVDKANTLMRVNGEESAQVIARVAEDGAVSFETLPDVRQLHYIMQALDDVAESAKTGLGRNTTESRAYGKLRSQLGSALKAEVPEFREAQKIAADTIRQERAIDLGYDLLSPKVKRETLAEALSGAEKAERDAMAQGVRSSIEDALSNVKRTITDGSTDAREAMKVVKDLSSRASHQKLTMVLGRERANQLFDALDRETIALELRAAIATNSKTAIRQSIQSGVKDQTTPGMVGTLMQGEAVDASKRFVQVFTGATPEAQELRRLGVFEEIATALTQIRGKGADRALKTVNAAIQNQPVTDAQAAQVAQVLVAASGLTANREAHRRLTTVGRD